MTVYFIEREYDSNVRIEVEEETQVSFRQGYDGGKNCVVFTEASRGYEDKTLAAFAEIKSLRKEGVNIQYLVMKETKASKKEKRVEPAWENNWVSVEDLKGDTQ